MCNACTIGYIDIELILIMQKTLKFDGCRIIIIFIVFLGSIQDNSFQINNQKERLQQMVSYLP